MKTLLRAAACVALALTLTVPAFACHGHGRRAWTTESTVTACPTCPAGTCASFVDADGDGICDNYGLYYETAAGCWTGCGRHAGWGHHHRGY